MFHRGLGMSKLLAQSFTVLREQEEATSAKKGRVMKKETGKIPSAEEIVGERTGS